MATTSPTRRTSSRSLPSPSSRCVGARPDVDGDAVSELFIGVDGAVRVFHAADLAAGGAAPFSTLDWAGDTWCLGDLDGDGREEVGLGYAR